MNTIYEGERGYLQLLRDVLNNGHERKTRNSITKSLFCKHIRFDLSEGFPLLTSKKMFFRGIVAEFIFFIKGNTDTKELEKLNVFIWKGNTNRSFLDQNGFKNRREGIMGPMYGYQWRHFNAPYNENTGDPESKGMDQLHDVIEQIKSDPHSRRIIMTDYNPLQAKEGVLFPCHSLIIQFYVEEGRLSIFCYNRSSDLFLGLPFNIASTALLLHTIAHLSGTTPSIMNISLGDCHIYESHYDAVNKQLKNNIFPSPNIMINNFNDIDQLSTETFKLKNYFSNDKIVVNMIA